MWARGNSFMRQIQNPVLSDESIEVLVQAEQDFYREKWQKE
jgi:hypothetical protein